MRIVLDLEDTFGDIVRKASRGNEIAVDALAARTGIAAARLEQFLADAASPTEDEARAVAAQLRLDGGKLADIALARWKPKERDLDPHFDHQINKPHPSNGYFVVLDQQRVAAFVDPGGSAGNIIGTLRRSPVALQYILVTHKHHDHTDALAEVRAAFPDARVVVHRLDGPALGTAARDAIAIDDGDILPFGDGELRLLHTPGHTDGSSCFIYEGNVFTGDTLFAGSVGGVFGDRFGYRDLLHSASSKIFSLPDDTVVFPGHGPPSTIGEERAHNPFF
jgi:glyoxylase-like metal-dependent hydrolase (beta-lactamase superfamily II)